MTSQESNRSFFRQAGWMVISTSVMGFFMYAVHVFARSMPKAEYGVFVALLQVYNLMGVPSIGLQSVFAQQAAAATTEEQHRQLRAAALTVTRWLLYLWILTAAVVFVFRGQIVARLQIANPAGLWATVLLGLAALWYPVWAGLLQGRQNFLWFGWATIANGVGRFVSVAILVGLCGGHAAGAMTGALCGVTVALGLAAWQNRDIWTTPCAAFDARDWLRRVVPMSLGLGAAMFFLAADMIVVQATFDKDTTGPYGAAGMIGRALIFFTGPVVAVMFPKVARTASADQQAVLLRTLGLTALLACSGAAAMSIVPWLPLRIVQGGAYLAGAPLVPWFAWAFVPLTLANVLIYQQLGQGQFRSVPWLVAVAVAYFVALWMFNTSFQAIIRTLGLFNLILLTVAGWFTWGARARPGPQPSAAN
jgi:O-antigen/teichoic acid export membrane protein